MHMVHIDDLELTQIRLLAELLRLHNVSAASQSIGLSQSAASHALARLRTQLGDPLFIRSGRGVQPTPYGERLGLAARESLDVLRAGLASNRPFDPTTTSRRFNIYTSDVGQMVFLAELSEFLSEKAPNASVRVLPIPLENPSQGLGSGDVDFAIGIFDNLTSGIMQSFLCPEHYVCIVRAGHPKFRRGMSLEAFLEVKHAIADSTGQAHGVIDWVLARHRIQRKDAVRVPQFHVLPMVIANSDLLAVIPNRLAQAFSRHLSIKILPTPVPIPPIAVNIYWHERYHNDPPNQWFRSGVVRIFREIRSRGSREGRSGRNVRL
jgi:DNA-binding transcriptional LysR family regulator